MGRRNRDKEKADRELSVFVGFAEFATLRGLRVRPGSAMSRPTPEPDILCELEGEGYVAFELVEIIDSTLAENISVSIRKHAPADGAWVGDPTLERIREKVEAKTYVTWHPMELVAWANPFITPASSWLPTFEPELRNLHGLSRFRRMWVVNLGGLEHERGVWFVNPPFSRRN
jgi:hypothetical protein